MTHTPRTNSFPKMYDDSMKFAIPAIIILLIFCACCIITPVIRRLIVWLMQLFSPCHKGSAAQPFLETPELEAAHELETESELETTLPSYTEATSGSSDLTSPHLASS